MKTRVLSALLTLMLVLSLLAGCQKEPESVFSLNGKAIEGFTIVTDKKTVTSADTLAAELNTLLGVTLTVVEKDEFDGEGNAILIGNYESNNYGDYRYEISATEADGSARICLDCSNNDQAKAAVEELLAYFTSEALAAKELDVTGSTFGYLYDSDEQCNITLLKESKTELASGVTYIEQTWRTESDGSTCTYLLVLSPEAVKGLSLTAPALGTVLPASEQMALAQSEGKNVIAATNAGFFHMAEGTNLPYGVCITDGEVLSEPVNGEKNSDLWFGVTKQGEALFGDAESYEDTWEGELSLAVSGNRYIFKDGKPLELYTEANVARGPSTTVALCADGSVVIFCSDGRNAGGSCGTNAADITRIHMDLDLDVRAIFKLDGGGSTTMVVREGNKNEVKNVPSDGEERAVQSVLLITVPQ